MHVRTTDRGFTLVEHDVYAPKEGEPLVSRLIQASSAIGDYDNSWDKPGSSFLWVGPDHHLNREQVAELIRYMQRWLDTGSLREES